MTGIEASNDGEAVPMNRSPTLGSRAAIIQDSTSTRVRCSMTTPLGVPVEPDV